MWKDHKIMKFQIILVFVTHFDHKSVDLTWLLVVWAIEADSVVVNDPLLSLLSSLFYFTT